MEELSVLNFTVKGQTFEIKFPNVGEYRRIEVLKQSLSGGQYYSMLASGLDASYEALDIIDIESYFSILCPKLLEAINEKAGSFSELGMLDFEELKSAYKEQFVPWWEKILSLIRKK